MPAVRLARPYRHPHLKRAVAAAPIARLTEEDLRPIRALEERLSAAKGQTISLVAYHLTERSR